MTNRAVYSAGLLLLRLVQIFQTISRRPDKMRASLSKRLSQFLFLAATSSSSSPGALSKSLTTLIQPFHSQYHSLTSSPDASSHSEGVLRSPWFAVQRRGAKVLGSDVRLGNVIQRKGRIYQVLKAQHTQHGRGGASIQVELRDVDSGNKTTERFRTDESIERVFVEEKHYTYLYTDKNSIVLMEPGTFEQIEVSKDLFGKAAAYLKEDMKVSVQLFDGRAMSASVPKRVTCTVTKAQVIAKGATITPQYKKVLLDNGLTVPVPSFILTGDRIVIDTTDDSYITRAKE
ncbi:uncharacterized protein LOC131149761 [Malania oleifera]|uniref:uncharacterized protein LOC131149761 n=1 Tax=Malania oleifera TaxID=397392 RepID=UPI0025AE1825|nr:uncharacterized protein LOC131149761 [Malania oleifera]